MGVEFSLVSWNVLQGIVHRPRNPIGQLFGPPRRAIVKPNTALVEHLRSFDADVMVLPELWKYRQHETTSWSAQIAEELGYELHEWVGPEPSRPRDIVPWRISMMTRIPVERLDDQLLTKVDGLGQRAVVRVRLQAADVTIAGAHIYGIHALRRGLRPWLTERADLRAITASHDVVVGDLNMWGPVVQRDANDLRRAIKGRTFPADRPHSQIDHVLVSDRLDVVESEVLPDLGSDHLGLRVLLETA